MERAREVIRDRKNYFRSNISKSVKTGKLTWQGFNNKDETFNGTFKSALYDHENIEKRFCPPIKPPMSFGNHTHLRFSQYAAKNNCEYF